MLLLTIQPTFIKRKYSRFYEEDKDDQGTIFSPK